MSQQKPNKFKKEIERIEEKIEANQETLQFLELSYAKMQIKDSPEVLALGAKIKGLKEDIANLENQKNEQEQNLKQTEQEYEKVKQPTATSESEEKEQDRQEKEQTVKEQKYESASSPFHEEERSEPTSESKDKNENNQKLRKKQRELNDSVFDRFGKIREELEQLKNLKEAQEDVSQQNLPEMIQAKSLFEDENPVKKGLKTTLLYVATFFSNLSIRDFERLVIFFLEDQQVSIKSRTKTTNEKGETQIITTSEKKQLKSFWQENATLRDQLYKECYLKYVRLDNPQKTIDFSLTYLRENVAIYFEDECFSYLEDRFKRAKILLFDNSLRVSIGSINLSVEMATADPDNYGCLWLENILKFLEILKLADNLAQNLAQNLALTTEQNTNPSFISSEEWKKILLFGLEEEQRDEFLLFEQLINLVSENQRRQFVLLRVSTLLDQMLEESGLKDEVESFLEWSIQANYQEEVLEIIKPLQLAGDFDRLVWLKQLLDRGNLVTRDKTLIFLYNCLDRSGNQIYKLLEKIKAWLPQPERSPDRYSLSNEYSLRLLFEYSWEKIWELKPEDYGCYPSKYQLFKALKHDSEDKELNLLFDWIFHPGLKYLINPDLTITQVTGSLIANWFNILWGFGKQEPAPDSAKIAEKLIQQVKAATNRNQQRELVQFWNDYTDYLLDETEHYEQLGDEEMRKKNWQLRQGIRQLLKQFKNL